MFKSNMINATFLICFAFTMKADASKTAQNSNILNKLHDSLHNVTVHYPLTTLATVTALGTFATVKTYNYFSKQPSTKQNYSSSAMQSFFNTNHEIIAAYLDNEVEFEKVKPKLDEYIQNGGDINEFFVLSHEPDIHITLLMYAAKNGSVALVQYLLNHGANPSLKNNKGMSIFYFMNVQLVNMFWMPCFDIHNVIEDLMKVFELLLNAIDSSEHKVIFEDWALFIEKFSNYENFDNQNSYSWTKVIKNLIYYGEEIPSFDDLISRNDKDYLEYFSGVPSFISGLLTRQPESCLKIFNYFMESLNESDRKMISPKLINYLQLFKKDIMNYQDSDNNFDNSDTDDSESDYCKQDNVASIDTDKILQVVDTMLTRIQS